MTKIILITGINQGFSYAIAEKLIGQEYTVFGLTFTTVAELKIY